MSTSSDLKFAKSHEWIRREEDDHATIGISHYAQESLGDITFVELPQVGTILKRGESFGVVESVKAASDLYAPAGGEVVAVNQDLENAPEKVNQSPYDEGWIIKIKLSDAAEIDGLQSRDDYESSL